MISNIKGKIKTKSAGKLFIEVPGGFSYEILVPHSIMGSIEKSASIGQEINLITYHYLQIEPSRSIPMLIGFLNEIEKEFFEKFITVSGVGPKAACRALALPISEIAAAIDRSDLSVLKTMPGIGEQRAREIIAKLQGKVGKFGLIQDHAHTKGPDIASDIKEEAMSVLLQLQYKKNEAENMITKALKRNPGLGSSEELLNEVYKARQNEKRK